MADDEIIFSRYYELVNGPDVAEVERTYPLPTINVQDLGPLDAFRVFMDYATNATGRAYISAHEKALRREAAIAIEQKRGHVRDGYEIQVDREPVRKAVADRFAPLLPAMRTYVAQRSQDPTTLNRLAWMNDEVEAAITSFPTMLKGASKWPELKEGIASMIANLGTNNAPAPPTSANVERIEWIPSTAAFEYIFSTLAKRGYFKIPSKRGKEGEPNLTEFARALLLAFDVKGRDGNSLNAEQLRVRLSPGSQGKLSESKEGRFQIPAANDLVIPNADELE